MSDDARIAEALPEKLGETGNLAGLRVVEIADESAEFVGLSLRGLGAEVIKIEPPTGADTRAIGPFVDDEPDPENSLHFWHYNRGKKSAVLELDTAEGRERVLQLIESADILLQSVSPAHPDLLGLAPEEVESRFPSLIHAVMTPFGETGPWSSFKGSDLVHLAMGGVMMCCGYDPPPGEEYDLPPIAPQLWHAYTIASEQMLYGIQVALLHRLQTGRGQRISCAVHEAVAKNTETDVMNWVMRRVEIHRQTCRHAAEHLDYRPTIASTKDGRWVMVLTMGAKDADTLAKFAGDYGLTPEFTSPAPSASDTADAEEPVGARTIPGAGTPSKRQLGSAEVAHRLVRSFLYESVPWREAQAAGMMWVPLRKPHENAFDEHWLARGTFRPVSHPELGRDLLYPVSKWISTATAWQTATRAPHVGEHTDEVLNALTSSARAPQVSVRERPLLQSPHGKPFALSDLRILDFSWFLASAGGTRFLSMFGAETIKVEWHAHPDTRLGAMAPVGGRAAREAATGPLEGVTDPDMGGQFNNKNTGKLGISLNVTHPEGLEIARELVRISDIVTEGFSPGVLEKWGLGYDRLRELNEDIIYVQQSGMGSRGRYGRFRTIGPIAGSFSGLSEMSGLPEPYMPAGWGYSYLDWIGAYSFAQAILSGVYHRELTGEGQYIDASQVETGLFAMGPVLLDWQINNRAFSRIGNRSPYKAAAPHGAYRTLGVDRWIAIAAFTEDEWHAVARVAGHPEWVQDQRFRTLSDRLRNQDALDAAISSWTETIDGYDGMARLQAAGVAAGVTQTAADRVDNDPQLAELDWLTEVEGRKIGRWPVYEVPVKLSRSPAHAGGRFGRGAPNYGQDNEQVFGDLLGLSSTEIAGLRERGVI
ncbi:CoA transferase [Microbacterium sp. SYP-A9085]|uniref:CaiB/BaiF CoA-transferase family protein n=1 Tax=Microbacterium sp. SYP-A9085 TaxID=2664454 RepID=UPI001C12ADEF